MREGSQVKLCRRVGRVPAWAAGRSGTIEARTDGGQFIVRVNTMGTSRMLVVDRLHLKEVATTPVSTSQGKLSSDTNLLRGGGEEPALAGFWLIAALVALLALAILAPKSDPVHDLSDYDSRGIPGGLLDSDLRRVCEKRWSENRVTAEGPYMDKYRYVANCIETSKALPALRDAVRSGR